MRERILPAKGPVVETWQPLIGCVALVVLILIAINC
jgi:hypothetical protein